METQIAKINPDEGYVSEVFNDINDVIINLNLSLQSKSKIEDCLNHKVNLINGVIIKYRKDCSLTNIIKWVNSISDKEYKKCSSCKEIIHITNFYDVSSFFCKPCSTKSSNDYRNTFDGFFNSLVSSIKSTAKVKTNNGRIDAGKCDIDKKFLIDLYKKQDKKCYYSGLLLNLKTNSEWKCSPERLDDNKGYTKDNVVLICLEFNVPYKWSLEKINKIDELIKTVINLDDLLELVNEARVKTIRKYNRKTIERYIENDIEYIKCNKCHEYKTRDNFNKTISQGCKPCFKLNDILFVSTLRGFILRRIKSARSHSKERNKKIGRNDNAGDFSITLDIILDKILEQKGRCYYSGIPLVFKRKSDWMMSLERLDNSKGYTKENTVLVCAEFNSTDQSKNSKNDTGSSSKWTKDKFKYFMQNRKK